MGETLPQEITLTALGGLFYMGIGIGIFVYLSFNFSLQHIEAGVVALFGNLIPIFSLLFAFLLLGERLNIPQMLGVVLTLFGVLIATKGSSRA